MDAIHKYLFDITDHFENKFFKYLVKAFIPAALVSAFFYSFDGVIS